MLFEKFANGLLIINIKLTTMLSMCKNGVCDCFAGIFHMEGHNYGCLLDPIPSWFCFILVRIGIKCISPEKIDS